MGEGQKITQIFMCIILLGQLCWTQKGNKDLNYRTSTYRQLCYDDCQTHGNNYFWCNTKKGWDYCSLTPNTDYKGNECKDDHPCDLHGEDYYWCNTKTGSWDYCGKVEQRRLLYKSSTYQSECRDECSYESESYYWCTTDKGWDYCSRSPHVTHNIEPCQSDHSCGTYGKDYSWCWTDSDWGYWGYCSIVEPINNCRTTGRWKRQPNNRYNTCTQSNEIEEICTVTDQNGRVIRITAEPDPNAIAYGRNWRNDVNDIISNWNSRFLRIGPRTLTTSGNLRLDSQGTVNRNNQPYYNFQIQVNVQRRKGASTSLTQVLIPQNYDVPEDYIRMAFTESFHRRARVFVDVSYGNIPVCSTKI